ncbi:MAG TPA: DUF2306 domain-containing protein [Allosphingosinicella sp.]|jgi:uncharacterized membrane protein
MIRSQIYSAGWRAIVALLTVEIAAVSVLRYFTSIEPPPPPILANAYADPFLPIHVASSVVALVLGPLQFVRRIRGRWPEFHRITGRLYVLGCAIGAPSGLVLALGTTAGPIVSVGFGIPAILCAAFTWLGWRAAVERRFAAHRDWMLRSYMVIAVAITLRLLIPAAALLDFDFLAAYRVNSWLAWILNMAMVEYVIRRGRAAKAGYATLAPA